MQTIFLSRDDLLDPVQLTSGAVERRNTVAILGNLLLEIQEGTLTVTATDLEIQISVATAVATTESLSATVSARKFQEILRALPEKSEVGLEVGDTKIQVKSGRSRFSLHTLPAKDYPRLAVQEGPITEFVLKQKAFKLLLQAVHYSMAHQDIRYYLNGLLLTLQGNRLIAVATDGHRLACSDMPVASDLPATEVILPRKAVGEIIRLLGDGPDDVHVRIRPGQVSLEIDKVHFTTKVIDGRFPDFNKVIPTGYHKTVRLERNQLLHCLQRVAILSNEKFRGVRWVVVDNTLRILSANAEQEEAQEEIPIEFPYAALDIGFNVGYLLDVLNNSKTTQVDFSFGDSGTSMLVTLPDDDSFKYVVMPMRI